MLAAHDVGLVENRQRGRRPGQGGHPGNRSPGKYTVVWDGKDDKGKVLPQGTYTVRVEVHREHGKHLFQTGKIQCGSEPAKLTLEANAETGETVVEYRKRKRSCRPSTEAW